MGNKGRSEPNIWGGYTHYDSKGHKIGSSDPSIFGGYTNYDAKGHKTGHSDPSLFGGYNHYDTKGNKTGHSDPSLFGGYNHYDSNGKRSGSSAPAFSAVILTAVRMAAILLPAYMAPMTLPKYGFSADSVILISVNGDGAVLSSTPITQSVPGLLACLAELHGFRTSGAWH